MGILLAAALTVSVILFVYLIYSLDNANPLQKKTEIINRLIDLFKAQPVTKDVMKFKINTFDFYTEIKVDFKQAFQLANVETINFHIPIDQFDRISSKPEMALRENEINGILTYIIYQANSDGLNLAKEKLEEMIFAGKPAANRQPI
jgi:hypothetical protein